MFAFMLSCTKVTKTLFITVSVTVIYSKKRLKVFICFSPKMRVLITLNQNGLNSVLTYIFTQTGDKNPVDGILWCEHSNKTPFTKLQFFKGWIALFIQWIMQLISLILIHWIVIYPVDSAIHCLNNLGQYFELYVDLTFQSVDQILWCNH